MPEREPENQNKIGRDGFKLLQKIFSPTSETAKELFIISPLSRRSPLQSTPFLKSLLSNKFLFKKIPSLTSSLSGTLSLKQTQFKPL